MLFLEIDPEIEEGVLKLLENDFTDVKIYKDHLDINRVLSAKLK